MTIERGSGAQGAIDFLTDPELGDRLRATLPPRPDYESLAEAARALGHDLSPGDVKEAFRLTMHARLLASRKISRIDGQAG